MVISQVLGRIHRDTFFSIDNKIVAIDSTLQQFCCFVKSWIDVSQLLKSKVLALR